MRWRSTTPAPPRRCGAVTAWLVVCLSVIVGIVGMGMDGGRMMEERRSVQMAADAAALAAANNLYLNWQQNQGTDPSGTAAGVALNSALANGYANDGIASIVTVNIPPQSGAFAGQKECVEVIIQSNLTGTFSAVFTRGPLIVRGRTVARGRPQNIGLILLQNYGTALSAGGNAQVNVQNAPILADTSASPPYSLFGNASVSALYHDVGGSLGQTYAIIGPINTNVPPAPDPLASLPFPSAASYPVQTTSSCGGPCSGLPTTGNMLQPGVYNGGINVSGNTSLTMAPGVYILNGGGLQVSGNASLSGSQVLIYNTGGTSAGSISVSGNGCLALTPPTSGTYQGISILQDRTLNNPIGIAGDGTIQLTGTVYAPAATVQLSGNAASGNITGGGYVVSSMQVSGNSNFVIDHGNNRPLVPEIGMVE